MAKTTLPTNYVDDVLNGAMDGKRRYREIPNADGTISFEDATTYDQIGSNFGAAQLNLMNENINQSFDSGKMLKTMEEVNAVTQEGYGVDALVVKQLSSSLTANNNQFYFDYQDGKYGFNTDPNRGADTFNPFNGGGKSGIFPTTANAWAEVNLGFRPRSVCLSRNLMYDENTSSTQYWYNGNMYDLGSVCDSYSNTGFDITENGFKFIFDTSNINIAYSAY